MPAVGVSVSALRLRAGRLEGEAALTSLGSVLNAALAGVSSIVIARALGVDARGAWAVISSLALFVGFLAMLGLPTAAAYAAGRTSGAERARIVQSALAIGVVLAVFAAAVYVVTALFAGPSGVHRTVVLAGGLIAAGTVVSQVVQSIVLTAGPLRWFAGMQVLTALAVLVAIVAAAAGNALTVGLLVGISSASTALAAFLGLRALAACGALGSERLVSSVRAATPVLRPYLTYALMTFATLSLTRVVQRFDVLLVNGFRGEHAAGLYATAAQFGDLMLIVPSAVGFALFRRGARGVAGHWEDAQQAIRWTAVVCGAGAVVIFALAGPLVDLTFGTAYHGSVRALTWLLPGLVCLGVQSVISSYVASRGRPRAVLVAWLAGAVVGVALDLVAIPKWGIAGAAAVSSLSYAVVVVLHVRALHQVREADA